MVKDLCLDYLLGFFESDGGFTILLKKDDSMTLNYRVFPVAIFWSVDKNILEKIFNTLKYLNIPCKNKHEKTRTPSVQIQGILNVKKFLDLITSNQKCFYSMKYIDFLYMFFLYDIIDNNKHNTVEGRKQIIDLKYHLHTLCFLDNSNKYMLINPEELKSTTLSREVWEIRHGFPVGSSLLCAQKYVQDAHKKYYCHIESLLKQIQNNTLCLSENFVTGAFEGDGSVGVSIRTTKRKKSLQPDDRQSLPYFDIQITLSGDIYSEIWLRAIASFFKDNSPYIRNLFPKKAFIYQLRKPQIALFIRHIKKFPLVVSQGKLAVFVYNVLEKKYNTNFHASRKIAKAIYNYGAVRAKRKKSYDSVISDFKDFYNTGKKLT